MNSMAMLYLLSVFFTIYCLLYSYLYAGDVSVDALISSVSDQSMFKSSELKSQDSLVMTMQKSLAQDVSVTCELSIASAGSSSTGYDSGNGNNNNKNMMNNHENVAAVTQSYAQLGRLAGMLLRKTTENYWRYEITFETEVIQLHGKVSNSLGKYVRTEGNTQIYQEGTICSEQNALIQNREAKVTFSCDTQLRILSIDEVAVCSYEILVGTPIVCGINNPSRGQDSMAASSAATTTKKPVQIENKDDTDSWFMELFEMPDGQIACSASLVPKTMTQIELSSFDTLLSSRNSIISKNQIQIKKFELSLKVTSSSPMKRSGSNSYKFEKRYLVCRNSRRENLSTDSREFSINEGPGFLVIRSLDGFKNDVSHIYLQAKVVL